MKITKLIWKLIIIGLKHGNLKVIYKAGDSYCWLDDKSIHVKNDMQINENKSVIINPFEPVS
jgi:hypothetical protein